MDDAASIDALDGVHHTLVALNIGDWEVLIGGGPERFILTATAGDHVANALTADDEDSFDDDTIELTAGGQAVDYPVQYALRRDELSKAIRDLSTAQPGERFPDARWEQ